MEVFLKKAAVKNFTISTEITWVWPSFLKSTMSEGNFIKKTPQHMCFLVNIVKFLRLLILKNICEWLLFDCFNGSMLHGLKIVYRLVNQMQNLMLLYFTVLIITAIPGLVHYGILQKGMVAVGKFGKKRKDWGNIIEVVRCMIAYLCSCIIDGIFTLLRV